MVILLFIEAVVPRKALGTRKGPVCRGWMNHGSVTLHMGKSSGGLCTVKMGMWKTP